MDGRGVFLGLTSGVSTMSTSSLPRSIESSLSMSQSSFSRNGTSQSTRPPVHPSTPPVRPRRRSFGSSRRPVTGAEGEFLRLDVPGPVAELSSTSGDWKRLLFRVLLLGGLEIPSVVDDSD